MINKEDFIVIHSLWSKGHNISDIARITKLDRKTIRNRLKQPELLSSNRIVNKIRKLAPYEDFIVNFLEQTNDRISATVILQEIIELGYKGKYTMLRIFMANYYKSRQLDRDPVVRFETSVAYQMQVDWTTIRSGRDPIY